ncbi:transcriptional regulator [Brevundimonas sp.]|uniref:winged helix-turn-helix domain-containing protein n=1 Tax=Brevundimonas sp. TaxID=1871086 RepID=UPI0035AE60BF
MAGVYRFDRFVLEPAERRLTKDGRTVELPGRCLDALILLVAEQGRLVTKARFMSEVWNGVPVTDEALTQCVRTLRKALGDEAGRASFIQTVPRHGYRFIAPIEPAEATPPAADRIATPPMMDSTALTPAVGGPGTRPMERLIALGRAGLIGGGVAGLFGGLIYGFAGVADGAGGAVSGLLVLAALTSAVGMVGGAGVGFGVGAAAAASKSRLPWFLIGGAGGGLVVGAVVRLVGLDAFSLLFGAAPTAMTGAGEGLMLGAAIGAGVWIARGRTRRVALLAGAVLTGLAGVGAALLGGRLMGGSLAALATQFPAARVNLNQVSSLLGEATFGPVSQMVTAGLEGAVFGAAMVLALDLELLHRPTGRPAAGE